MIDNFPLHLLINERPRLSTKSFQDNDKLYHSYKKEDLGDDGRIKQETIRFPDFSCNWSQFSEPKDVLYRNDSSKTDGCYSFTVIVSRFNNIATPVHDPIDEGEYQNYAHVEIRLLKRGEDIFSEPPKKRKIKAEFYKSLRREYRFNICWSYMVEFEPTE
jgi:hypothetical protein